MPLPTFSRSVIYSCCVPGLAKPRPFPNGLPRPRLGEPVNCLMRAAARHVAAEA
jgi:hypothetical protein